MAGAFEAALDKLYGILDARPFDAWAARSAFYEVKEVIGAAPDVDDLRRMLDACMFALDLGDVRRPAIANADHARSLSWAVDVCLLDVLIDQRKRNRSFAQSSVTRQLAFGVEPREGEPTEPLPLMHIALSEAQAAGLIAPYLRHLEAELAEDPLSHLNLCWQVFESPVPLFHMVFDRWLAELDQKRGTHDLSALRRAMALATLAQEGRQRISWADCEEFLLPQLSDPHPLVAAAAAKYLGMLYADEGEMFTSGTPKPILEMLAQFAALPLHRRAVAGGFLDGGYKVAKREGRRVRF